MEQTKLSILHVTPYFAPAFAYGGSPAAATTLAIAQAALGHTVRVLTSDALDAHSRVEIERDEIQGVQVRYLPNRSNRLAWKHKLFAPRDFSVAAEQMVDAADIVHIHEFRSFTSYWAATAARAANKPYVLSAHGSLARLGISGRLRTILDKTYGRRLIRHCQGFCALSSLETDLFKKYGAGSDRIVQLPNAVDLPDIDSIDKGDLRCDLGIDGDQPLILFIGRLNQVKGVDLLLQAGARLLQQNQSAWKMAVIGPDDGRKSSLIALCSKLGLNERVAFLGYFEKQRIWTALRDADLLVLPSRYDAFPICAIEALGLGCPVVVSSAVGIHHEIAKSGNCGVFRSGDIDGLAQEIVSVIAQREDRAQRAQRARDWIVERYSSAAVAQRSIELYRKFL
ncbi:MAG: glycosyltransferase family 4 protein [Candidatus Alcyoniella australis]|nr:glycosyltransferase family 4 protein [Candidatus Alcyoniella australis]